MGDARATKGGVMEATKARVICNPSSGGGGYEPDEIRKELDGLDVEWVQTEKPGDAV